jgi:hypothetical protein
MTGLHHVCADDKPRVSLVVKPVSGVKAYPPVAVVKYEYV